MSKSMFEKKDKGMDPIEKEARMTAVKAMRKMAEDEMNGKLSGLKKVTVASDSPEGLEEGLAKAKELVGETPEGMEDDEETPEMEDSESSDIAEMSEEEIDKKLEELMALKRKTVKSV